MRAAAPPARLHTPPSAAAGNAAWYRTSPRTSSPVATAGQAHWYGLSKNASHARDKHEAPLSPSSRRPSPLLPARLSPSQSPSTTTAAHKRLRLYTSHALRSRTLSLSPGIFRPSPVVLAPEQTDTGASGVFGIPTHFSFDHFVNTIAPYFEEEKPTPRQLIDSIIRVDHAGELGAQSIYQGQLAVLGSTPSGPIIEEMMQQEVEHLRTFEGFMSKYRARPTLLYPLWQAAGFGLGFFSAVLGKEAAMACTVAVETVITDHYNSQLRALNDLGLVGEEYKELRETIRKFRDDEEKHHAIGLSHDAKLAPFYELYSQVIQTGCRVAIFIAKKI